jgi:hypothetical protein
MRPRYTLTAGNVWQLRGVVPLSVSPSRHIDQRDGLFIASRDAVTINDNICCLRHAGTYQVEAAWDTSNIKAVVLQYPFRRGAFSNIDSDCQTLLAQIITEVGKPSLNFRPDRELAGLRVLSHRLL